MADAEARYPPSVTVARLYERVSRKGTHYLAGRLGLASVVLLKTDEVSDDGQPIWVMKLNDPPARANGQGKPKRSEAAGSDRDGQAPDEIERRIGDADIPF